MDTRNKSCCFTGHRVIPKRDYKKISDQLELVVLDLITQGFTNFYVGGALGFDTLAAKTVIKAKKLFSHVKLKLILPCRDQSIFWNDHDKKVYNEILKAANSVEYVADRYTPTCMFERNRRLVDASSVCVCYLVKDRGGTVYTVDYAKKQGLRIINIAGKIEI